AIHSVVCIQRSPGLAPAGVRPGWAHKRKRTACNRALWFSGLGSREEPISVLERAGRVVGVLVTLEGGRDGLQVQPAFIVLDDLHDVHALNREAVIAKLEVSAHRLEI